MANETLINTRSIEEHMLNEGVVYYVPPSKVDKFYGEGIGKEVRVSDDERRYLEPFMVEGSSSVLTDVFEIGQDVPREVVGMDGTGMAILTSGIRNYFEMSQGLVKHPGVKSWLRENLSDEDARKLEMEYANGRRVIGSGSLVRVDVVPVYRGGRLGIASVDPNVMPLGMAFHHSMMEARNGGMVEEKNKAEIYMGELAELANGYPERISGIVTGLGYSNWRSHEYVARKVRENYGASFYLIPDFCVSDNGLIDVEELIKFHQGMGLGRVGELATIVDRRPGVLVRYVREMLGDLPDSYVINRPGTRVVESQLWKAVAHLQGIEELTGRIGVRVEAIRDAVVPSVLMRLEGERLEMAYGVSADDRCFEVEWVEVDSEIGGEVLSAMQSDVGGTGKVSWVVKGPATSGKKAVMRTSGKTLPVAHREIAKTAVKYGFDKGIFIVQPKVDPIVDINGEERRVKGNVYLSGEGLELVGDDLMSTPVEQWAVHGGSGTYLHALK